eukprot:8001119-Heterocapsa_arctica.AAC.1
MFGPLLDHFWATFGPLLEHVVVVVIVIVIVIVVVAVIVVGSSSNSSSSSSSRGPWRAAGRQGRARPRRPPPGAAGAIGETSDAQQHFEPQRSNGSLKN